MSRWTLPPLIDLASRLPAMINSQIMSDLLRQFQSKFWVKGKKQVYYSLYEP